MRWREPAAWVALGALVLNLVLALVGLATFEGPLVSMGWMLSEQVANPMPLIALTVLVILCVFGERTPHARQLTLVSLIVGLIAVLLGLTLALLGIGATAPILAVFAVLVPQAICIFAIGILIKLLRLQAVPRRLPPGIGLVVVEHIHSDYDQDRVDQSESLPTQPPPKQPLQPAWHADAAADAGWLTAVDTAAPARGDGMDTPTVRLQPTSTNGSNGRRPGDSAVQPTVPMVYSEERFPPRPVDPWADQNTQPLALDWSGGPHS